MYDKVIILNILNNINWSIETILRRAGKIECYEDFLKNDTGRETLDSICMQLINIGEALKEIDKITSYGLLINYSEVDWKAAKGMRDILTHHYFDVDAEIIYNAINDKLPILKETINKIISNLNPSHG